MNSRTCFRFANDYISGIRKIQNAVGIGICRSKINIARAGIITYAYPTGIILFNNAFIH